MNIENTVAVVTGGASGIGRGAALALARAGADIAIADLNQARLEQTHAEIVTLGRRCLAVKCDVSSDTDVERLAEAVVHWGGPVDILMNNAGVVLRGALEQIPMADWEWIFGINLFGVVRGIRAFLPTMIERRSGHIINTGSVCGLLAPTGEGAPYIASKFAVVGLSEALALYARPFGVGVSVLCPGSVDTNLAETGRSISMTPEREVSETAVAATVQGNRVMSPDEVGHAVVAAVRQDQFFVLPDPFHQPMLEQRARDPNAFLEARLRQST